MPTDRLTRFSDAVLQEAMDKKQRMADEAEKDKILSESGKDVQKISVQRYKGLGEMNADQLCDTTMDPVKRNIIQIHLDDNVEAERIFTTLMGEVVQPRKEFIEQNALLVSNLDV